MPATQPISSPHSPTATHHTHHWGNLRVQQFSHPPGECDINHSNDHTIYLSLAPRPIRMQQIQDGQSYVGLYGKGDLSVQPSNIPLFARWHGNDHCLQIQISDHFIKRVAQEALEMDVDRLELMPGLKLRDPQIQAIGMLLRAELKSGHVGGQLYADSVANLLAVHLLRTYTTVQPAVATYGGGLPQWQLMQVLDYIHEHLDQTIKLADLALLLNMSQFHFSHLFKQSLGIPPYQYLIQQRVERAKQLLKQTAQPITEIALLCGFNSHSHLTKQFRQVTGMTPKTYRLQ